jgi:hypothetical protein
MNRVKWNDNKRDYLWSEWGCTLDEAGKNCPTSHKILKCSGQDYLSFGNLFGEPKKPVRVKCFRNSNQYNLENTSEIKKCCMGKTAGEYCHPDYYFESNQCENFMKNKCIPEGVGSYHTLPFANEFYCKQWLNKDRNKNIKKQLYKESCNSVPALRDYEDCRNYAKNYKEDQHFDIAAEEYCKQNNFNSSYCSCFKSLEESEKYRQLSATNPDWAKGLLLAIPHCNNKDCITHGYKSQGLRDINCNSNISICNNISTISNAENNKFSKDALVQKCYQEISNSENKKNIINIGNDNTGAGGNDDDAANNNSTLKKYIKDNTSTIILILITIFFIIIFIQLPSSIFGGKGIYEKMLRIT